MINPNKCVQCGAAAELTVAPESGSRPPMHYCRACATKLADPLDLPALKAQLAATPRADLPPEYYKDVQLMNDAARAWFKAHPFAEPWFRIGEFEAEYKRRAGRPEHENVMIATGLTPTVIDQVAVNEDGKSLLRAMDAATNGRGTYFQAKVLIELAIEAQVKRGQHHMQGDGWICPTCGKRCDGISMPDGSGPPPAGTIGVCFYCGGLQRVNADVTGFDAMTDAELRACPKGLRMQVHRMRNAIQKRIAEEAKRS